MTSVEQRLARQICPSGSVCNLLRLGINHQGKRCSSRWKQSPQESFTCCTSRLLKDGVTDCTCRHVILSSFRTSSSEPAKESLYQRKDLPNGYVRDSNGCGETWWEITLFKSLSGWSRLQVVGGVEGLSEVGDCIDSLVGVDVFGEKQSRRKPQLYISKPCVPGRRSL